MRPCARQTAGVQDVREPAEKRWPRLIEEHRRQSETQVPVSVPLGRRVLRRAWFFAAAVLALVAVLVGSNTLQGDDPLPGGVPANAKDAIERFGAGCGRLAHIVDFEIDGGHLRYRCTWTIFGWPSVSSSASCGPDGAGWQVGGWREPQQTDRPC